MAVRPLVRRSIEDETGQRCVDIAVESGRFGWIECRRDPEDGYGWRPLGGAVQPIHDSFEEALEAACDSVPWLRSAL